jgi:alpha-glucosidase (family GH31 glycosyl hydrolase)
MKNSNDFTYDEHNYAGLPEFVDELHREGMHYMIIIGKPIGMIIIDKV